MALESSLANIVIRNNTIDQGRVSDGASPVIYNYDYNAWIFGSANITGNSFLSAVASTDMLNIDGCSCTITNNKFVRGATSINSYVRGYGSQDQFITNNLFDSTTINGSSLTLVTGISARSFYARNKNQTGTLYIPINETISGTIGNSDQFYVATQAGTSDYKLVSYKLGGLVTAAVAVASIALDLVKIFNISARLEQGVKITEIKLGVFVLAGTITPSSTQAIARYNIMAASNDQYMTANNATYITQPTLFATAEYIVDSAQKVIDVGTATEYVIYTPSATDPYFTMNKDYAFFIKLRCATLFGATDWQVNYTPLKITYVW